MSLELSNLKKWFSQHREAVFHDFFQFLEFKSIATDPKHHKDTKQCAEWLASYLRKIGLETEMWPTSGQPVIFAHHCKAKNRPTLLLYHHYDVQPVDPLNLWTSDPFTPTVRDGQIYARGALDNKGQCFYSITAIKALLELCKPLNFNLKVFIEGEEESGSNGTREVFESKQKELECDDLLIIDSGLPEPGIPAITLGIRGIMTLEVICRVANADMHSGEFGGVAYNPNRALVNALSHLWDEEGKVAIPHFYDDVDELSAEELKMLHIERDEKKLKKEFGIKAFSPEPGYTIGQSAAIRPTVEINGMSGGYAGEGFKTVLPAVAVAKLSCRLVPHQDPKEISTHLKNHLMKFMPAGMEVTINFLDQGSPAFRSSHESLIAKRVAKAYEEVLGKPCQYILIGGSIPITVELAKSCKGGTLLMGYGLHSDQIHAPDEHFGIDRFEQGFLTMGRIFDQLNKN